MTEVSISPDNPTDASATDRPSTARPFRKRWLLLWAVFGTVVGAGVYSMVPQRYEASATIQVVPPRIPDYIVKTPVRAPLSQRLEALGQRVLSRTRLEALITEFDLYGDERRETIMEDLVERMRKAIELRVMPQNQDDSTFRVSFAYSDAEKVMRVTARLAQLVIDDSLRDREVYTQGTVQFLESQAEELKSQLAAREMMSAESALKQPRQPLAQDFVIETEVLQETYRTLYRNLLAAQMAAELETRQIGEQFRLMEAAHLPETPIGPSQWPFLALGAVGGISVGLLLQWVLRLDESRWRRRMQGTSPA